MQSYMENISLFVQDRDINNQVNLHVKRQIPVVCFPFYNHSRNVDLRSNNVYIIDRSKLPRRSRNVNLFI